MISWLQQILIRTSVTHIIPIKILKTAPSLYSTEVECNASNASLALVIIWLLRLLLHARASGALWRRKEVKH